MGDPTLNKPDDIRTLKINCSQSHFYNNVSHEERFTTQYKMIPTHRPWRVVMIVRTRIADYIAWAYIKR